MAARICSTANVTTTSPVAPSGTAAMARPAMSELVIALYCCRTMVAATPPTVIEAIVGVVVPACRLIAATMM